MPVYLIAAGETGPIKIGHAKDVWRRLSEIQVGHHERLSIVRILDGSSALERALHARFAHLRLAGEWFTRDAEMFGPLDALDLPVERPSHEQRYSHRGYDEIVRRVLAAVGGPSKLAKALGISHCSVLGWKAVPHRHLIAVEIVTGIPRAELNPELFGPVEVKQQDRAQPADQAAA